MKKIKELFQKVETKHGAYSVGVIAVVIAIVVVVNLIVGQLPENIRNIDISNNKIYEITDTSKKLVKNLNKKITLNMIGDKSTVDERITTFVKKYAAMSKNITINWVDPVLHPNALSQYNTEANSIVVSCEDTDKMVSIPFTDIIVSDMYSYYTTGSASESKFDAEGQITSAINQVTTEVSKTIYRTSGHGEATLSTSVTDLMEKANYTVEEFNSLMQTEIPDDCDLLMINAPTTDFTEDEKTMLSSYLQAGGRMMILLGSEDKSLPNLEALMKEYGMQLEDGFIADTQRNYQQNPYYIFPQISASGDLAEGLATEMVLIINSRGLTETDPARDTITMTPFMQTSSGGYAVTEDAQKEGTYILGAAATEDIGGDDESTDTETEETTLQSRLTVISGGTMIDSQVTDSFTTLENLTLFMNAVNSNFDDVSNVSIAAKSLTVEYNTVKYAGAFSLLVIFGVPLIVLITGLAVWWKRRRA